MEKNLIKDIKIILATITDYPAIQNMGRFYVYDFSRYCGFISKDWAIPQDGMYECFDFKKYFENNDTRAYLVQLEDGELVGFVLLDKQFVGWPAGSYLQSEAWNIGEFFILAKFQRKGIASYVAKQIWLDNPGKWEASVIPENKPALAFWRKTIAAFTDNNYTEIIKIIDYDKAQPKRYIFNFATNL